MRRLRSSSARSVLSSRPSTRSSMVRILLRVLHVLTTDDGFRGLNEPLYPIHLNSRSVLCFLFGPASYHSPSVRGALRDCVWHQGCW